MYYDIFADCTLAALLVIAIAYCRKLDGKLRKLRRGEESMLEAAGHLTEAIGEARGALASMTAGAAQHGRLSGAQAARGDDDALRRRLG